LTWVKRSKSPKQRLLWSWKSESSRREAGNAKPIQRGRAMNYLIATADRTTHLKVVVVALFWAVLVTGVAIALA